jgi:4-hydroxy-tetrahydrodipicolinate synthase
MGVFSGIWIPLITPFARGAVDHDALRTLVKKYADAGISGLVALGTTGEPASLSESEQDEVLATILGAAAGLPVVAGLAGNNLAQSSERVAYLSKTPVAGILISPPYYIRPSQAGIIDYFMQLADTSTKPVVLYEIPYRTGVRIEIETLLTLAAHPQIQAIKDCAGSFETTLALIGDGRLQVLAGDDINIFTTLCLGGSGGILASAHIRPELFVAMYHAVAGGRLEEGREIFRKLVPIIQALFAEANPGPVKAVLALEGPIRDELRAPMTRATEVFWKRWRQLSID